jgi:Copper type II ascorbate-dependent monooxygenase, C-terminal domain
MHRGRRISPAAAGAAVLLLLAACGSSPQTDDPTSSAPAASPTAAEPSRAPIEVAALEAGERWIDLGLPGGSYTPQADAGGTDDYRCILLDPGLTSDSFLSGVVLVPGNAKLVHHAILYRVDPAQVAAAQAKDAEDPRLGWSCFGGPGLPDPDGAIQGLNAAPWVAAFATTGGEQRFRAGTGMALAAHSLVVLQIHYNLLNGTGADNTVMRLRVAPGDAHLTPLHTLLLPAPVELPCAAGESGPLCDRDAAVLDVIRRFGQDSGRTVAGLQLLCDGSLTNPRAGPTQTCAREVTTKIQIQAVAGHMHLLGRSIRVDLLRADGTKQTLLDVKAFDFDDQRALRMPKPVPVNPGDTLRVTCTHDATLRQQLPELQPLPPRYVVWGEGSSDEMCLGIVSYTDA